MEKELKPTTTAQRLVSLDVMRGVIMILLAAESCLLYLSLNDFHFSGIGGKIVTQFFHHPWNGLRAWDLVQPAFMYMAGAAMYISYFYKTKKGISWQENFKHIATRCLKLFIFGVALHCVHMGKLVWELWNVLTQLAFTTVIAYAIIRWKPRYQILFSIVLLVLTEILYRFTNIPGYDQPFVMDKNFGSFMDMIFMGKLNAGGGWVTINIIPTAAHTIWGVVTGHLLIQSISGTKKIKTILLFAAACLLIGYGLDWAGITPIIKRISTSSFVFASGGWVLLMMAFLYWLTDVKGINKYAWIFVVVGMNPIFIYLFFETVGVQWLNGTTGIFVKGFTGLLGFTETWQALLTAFVALFIEWYICYWLYTKKIFFKL